MESLDGDDHFVVNVNSGLFNFSESAILEGLDLSNNPNVEAGSLGINLDSGVNLDHSNFLFDSEFPLGESSSNSSLTVVDNDGNLDLNVSVDSGSLIN